MVIFSGLQFIFRFLPIFLLVYYLVPAKFRNGVLLVGSLVFYASGVPEFVILLIILTVINWWFGCKISMARRSMSRMDSMLKDDVGDIYDAGPGGRLLRRVETRRQLTHHHAVVFLVVLVVLNAGVLTACKILALTVDSKLLPLGMSFYIFKMISFIADCYTGKITKPQTFINTAAYFTMFPQITQGPIMRFDEKYWETKGKTAFQAERFEKGIFCFIIGLCLKVLLADRIGILWNEIDKIGFESISTPLAWLGAYGYSFELYFDFFGYSLMAAGLGMMLGFPFVENFHHPYASDGVAKFYRDWHVTLGAWFRDYIYFPLGGSHCSKKKNIRNLLIVWLITGLWHGGTLNFVIWGLVLGLIIIWEKFVMKGPMEKFKVIGHFHVMVLIPLTWVIFAIPDLGQLGLYFTRLFPFSGNSGTAGNVDPGDVLRYLNIYWPLFAASAILCVPATYRAIEKLYKKAVGKILLVALFWVAVYYMTISSSNAFMYFSF